MADGGIPTEELFDAAFVEQLRSLRITTRRVPRGGRFAEHRSRDLGSGIEFRDFRPYVAGDDLRSIDWNIYRRLGRIFLRLFEELEDLPVYLMPDVSQSMWLETPPRARTALRTALAITYVALQQHDRVGVLPFAEDADVAVRPRAGKRGIWHFAERLAELTARGGTDLPASLERIGAMRLRSGLLVVISDFFDPRGLAPVLDALALLRHRVLLVPIVRQSDRKPDLSGDVRLIDCETGDAQDVSVTPAVLARYEEAYAAFEQGLTDFARRRGHGLARIDADEAVVPQLARLFEGGRLVV